MRILTVSNCPLSESSGSGYVINNFCRGLRERGHEVDLFGPESYELWPFLRGKAKSYRQAVGMLGLVRRQMRRNSYDVVEFYGAQSWLAASLLSRKRRRNYLLVSHSNGLETHHAQVEGDYWGQNSGDGQKRKWYQLDQSALYAQSFIAVDGIATVCYQDVPFALKHGYQDEDHLIAIDNGLPAAYLGLEIDFNKPRRVGFCGSWLPRKGIAAIGEGMTTVLRRFPNWKLHLIGVGKDFDAAAHFAADVLPRVEVAAHIESKTELQALYQNMAIFLMPSIHESFGLVAAEAMACGCALVATETGFAARLATGKEACIIRNPDGSELAAAVSQLIEDEALRVLVARNGYLRVQNLRWDTAVETLESVYLRWLGEVRNRSLHSLKPVNPSRNTQ